MESERAFVVTPRRVADEEDFAGIEAYVQLCLVGDQKITGQPPFGSRRLREAMTQRSDWPAQVAGRRVDH